MHATPIATGVDGGTQVGAKVQLLPTKMQSDGSMHSFGDRASAEWVCFEWPESDHGGGEEGAEGSSSTVRIPGLHLFDSVELEIGLNSVGTVESSGSFDDGSSRRHNAGGNAVVVYAIRAVC